MVKDNQHGRSMVEVIGYMGAVMAIWRAPLFALQPLIPIIEKQYKTSMIELPKG